MPFDESLLISFLLLFIFKESSEFPLIYNNHYNNYDIINRVGDKLYSSRHLCICICLLLFKLFCSSSLSVLFLFWYPILSWALSHLIIKLERKKYWRRSLNPKETYSSRSCFRLFLFIHIYIYICICVCIYKLVKWRARALLDPLGDWKWRSTVTSRNS